LAVLVAGIAAAVLVPRRLSARWARRCGWALAAVIFAGWAGEYVADLILGTWSAKYTLPLQLTDAVSLTAIAALLTRRQLLVELVYYWAFSASLQAALTPDLSQTFPSVFYFAYFMYHVGAIVAAVFLVFGCRLYPRHEAMWRVYLITLGFACVAGIGDVITGGNYMYLRSKPVHNSLLNVMGPWPVYIAAGAAIGLAMFLVLRALADWAARAELRKGVEQAVEDATGHVLEQPRRDRFGIEQPAHREP
jgi:hypothetical integral membrane protein (TIGR02206 family)